MIDNMLSIVIFAERYIQSLYWNEINTIGIHTSTWKNYDMN